MSNTVQGVDGSDGTGSTKTAHEPARTVDGARCASPDGCTEPGHGEGLRGRREAQAGFPESFVSLGGRDGVGGNGHCSGLTA